MLYLGRVVELGTSQRVFTGPSDSCAEVLPSPVPNFCGSIRKRIMLTGVVPSPSRSPSGCMLNPRYLRRAGSDYKTLCETGEPNLTEVEPEDLMRCHIPNLNLEQVQNKFSIKSRPHARTRWVEHWFKLQRCTSHVAYDFDFETCYPWLGQFGRNIAHRK